MSKRRIELGLAEAALLFAALGDETRLALLRRLAANGPASIAALRFLGAAGIIDGRRAGREHVWALNPARLAEAQRCLDIIARGWDDALSRLKRRLEG